MSLLMLRALLFAGECFAASLLLPVLVFAATALLRRAALRHLIWTTLFGVLAVLPVAALLLPARRIVEHVAAPAAALPVAAPAMMTAALAVPASPLTPPLGELFTLENGVALLAVLWLAGLAWQLLRFAVGGLGLMRLRRASVPFASEIETGCVVRLCAGEAGPSTFGILRPLILLPRAAEGWPAARLDAVLRHEAAHVARRDTLSQFVAQLVCALYWFNPLLWLSYRALRREAEIAADDAVLASGMTPSLYAAELVALAAQSRGIASPIPLGIAMAGPPLVQRVQSVLAENSSRKGVSRMDIAKTVSFGLAATLLLGTARFDIAVAQDAPVAVAPVAAAAPAPPVTDAERAIEAQTKAAAAQAERVKARADRVTAQAKAKADTENDPVKAAQYRDEAAKVAARAARVKAQADRAAAQYADEARKHMGLAFQLAEEVRQKALANRSEADIAREKLAEARRVNDEAMQQAGAAMRAGAEARRQAMQAMTDAHIDRQVAKALADVHISEIVAKALADAHIDETARKAVADAHIEQRIAEAMARVQPQIDAAAKVDMTPAPIPPAPPPPAPVPPPPYAPN